MKIGSTVKCVSNYKEKNLTLQKEYTIKDVGISDGKNDYLIVLVENDKGKDEWYHNERFELPKS